VGHVTFWINLSLRPKIEIKRLSFSFSSVLKLTNRRRASSLTSSATHRWFRRISLFICFAHENSISRPNWLTYLVHAKSTSELINISIRFSDRSVINLVSVKRSANRRVQTKNDFTFLADLRSQSEFRTQRKSQRKTDPKMTQCIFTVAPNRTSIRDKVSNSSFKTALKIFLFLSNMWLYITLLCPRSVGGGH